MSFQDRRARRREMRRTSPDAPQGRAAVAVLTGVLALIAVLGLRAAGFPWTDQPRVRVDAVTVQTTVPGDQGTVPEALPTTTLITGSTSPFVATTTPITTTSSTSSTSTTTTTVPAADRLTVSPTTLTFDHQGQDVSFTVKTPLKGPVGFFVTDVPAGFEVSGRTGRATRAKAATITVQMVDEGVAESGRIIIVGADGAKVPVLVRVAGESLEVTAVTWSPASPRCNDPVTVHATVVGAPTTVRLSATVGSTSTTSVMHHTTGSVWEAVLPGRPSGVQVGLSVYAVDTGGATASSTPTSFAVTGGWNC